VSGLHWSTGVHGQVHLVRERACVSGLHWSTGVHGQVHLVRERELV
jgi:hypothetical protein